ncbi:MAG: hypothetical protein JWN12_386 [Candidatus Saccharibacteria bacterium]|nr:hypothetical protein [Candidatus Saccharibacteria bacterium]
MKRMKRIILTAIVALMPFAFALPAAALGTCAIGYTGPDSNNQCISQTKFTCTVQNENDVTIVNDNDQTSTSGTVTNSGNSQGGGAISGQVTNSNGTVFDVSITNTGYTKTCVAVATVPATPATPVTPVTPVQPQTGSGAAVAALPQTSGDSFSPILAIVLAALGIGAAATYLGATIYRRLNS